MSTKKVALRLVELCRTGQNQVAVNELYSDDIISLEPAGAPLERVEGKEGVLQKGAKLNEMIEEWHGVTVSDALVAGEYFTLTMGMDVTYKDGNRVQAEEVCVYQVKNGKIITEQFFFNAG